MRSNSLKKNLLFLREMLDDPHRVEEEEGTDPAGRVEPGGVRRVGEKNVRLGLQGMSVPSSSKCWRGGARGVDGRRGVVRLEMEGPGGGELPCEWMVGGGLQTAGMRVSEMERGEELEEGLVVAGEVLVLCDVGGFVVL